MTRAKGLIGILILVAALFLIFLMFAFSTLKGLRGVSALDSESDGPIAVVKIDGVILDSKTAVEELMLAAEDTSIDAIIVRVDSPGGAVGPTQEIYEEIRRIDQDVKPVYASFGSIAASGGYYIGAACRKIFTNAGTLTGSIGVIMQFMDLSRLYDWAKLNPEIVKAGKYKDIGNPVRSLNPEERQLLSELVDEVHQQFINDIQATRKEKIQGNLEEHAQGQIFSGQGAISRGLADEVAGLWQAGRLVHQELKLERAFGLKFIKKKKAFQISDFIEGLEESFQGKTLIQRILGNKVPLLMARPSF